MKMKLNIQRFASGTIDLGTDGPLTGQIVWSSSSNGSAANSSNVTATLQIRRNDGYTTTGTFSGGLNINGDNRGWSWYGSLSSGLVSVASFTITVGHDSDGQKVIWIGGSCAGPSGTSMSGRQISNSAPVRLDTIPRYATTNSVSGSNIEEPFKVNYSKYVSSWNYVLRISIPNVEEVEKITYNTPGAPYTLTKNSIERLYDRFPNTNTFNLGFAIETWSGNSRLSAGNEVIKSCTKVDRVGRIRVGNEWKRATPYVRVNGEWKKATPYTRINNEWKRGK